MTGRTRRQTLRATGSALAGVSLAGCLSNVPFVTGDETETRPSESLDFETWVPKPATMNGRKHYLLSDVIFWNLERVRSFRDSLHPEFYCRIAAVPDAEDLEISPESIEARIDVASQSASIYLGDFDPETVASALKRKGLSKREAVGSFELFTPGESGYTHEVGVSADAFVVGKGAGIEMAGDDDRTSQIDSSTAVVETIRAHRDEKGFAETNEALRSLTNPAESLSVGSIRTFERVSTPTPETLDFEGGIGYWSGCELSRPKSTFVLGFLFSDSSEAVVEPIKRQVERKRGTNEYEDVTYTTDGAKVIVKARMANERFDGTLSGDPEDRA